MVAKWQCKTDWVFTMPTLESKRYVFLLRPKRVTVFKVYLAGYLPRRLIDLRDRSRVRLAAFSRSPTRLTSSAITLRSRTISSPENVQKNQWIIFVKLLTCVNCQSTNQSINRTTNQSTNQSIHRQSINQSTNHTRPINQSSRFNYPKQSSKWS